MAADQVPSPERILRVASGFMAAKHLFVASALGVFGMLADGPKSLDDLARLTGVDRRSLRIPVDAMVALGLLERSSDGSYRNAADSQIFLTGTSPADLSPLLKFWDKLSYRNWMTYEESVRKRTPSLKEPNQSPAEAKIFSQGVQAITTPQALGLAQSYDFGRHRKLADLGGGTGSFLLAILSKYPALECTLFELPETARIARQVLSGNPLGGKVRVVDGDAFKDRIPQGQDCLILANVVHLFSAEHNLDLLRRIREQVDSGTRLLLVDLWTDPTHTKPAIAPILAGEFLTVTGEGDVYSLAEVKDWLAETGWKFVEQRELGGPASLIVAESD